MSERWIPRAYWASTALFCLLMLYSAGAGLIPLRAFVQELRRLGYPDHLLTLLGIAKLLGVATLLVPRAPRLKEWAYAGFAFVLGGAMFSHMTAGSTVGELMPSVLCASVLAISYVAYRGGGRTVPALG